MNESIAGPLLTVTFTAIFFYILFLVIRAGVAHGIRRALRSDLLAPQADGAAIVDAIQQQR